MESVPRKSNWFRIILVLLVVFAVVAVVAPTWFGPPTWAKSNMCMSNLRQVGFAVMLYADDHNGRLPRAANWCDAIGHRMAHIAKPLQEVLTCPSLPRGEIGGYAFNSALSGAKWPGTVPSRTVVGFESSPGWNVHGGSKLLLKEPRHNNRLSFLFEDGHTQLLSGVATKRLVWDPALAVHSKQSRESGGRN